ncbi:hypothetical protein CL634_08420 [bacterium]|nr:hypothetical protein [bacterium]
MLELLAFLVGMCTEPCTIKVEQLSHRERSVMIYTGATEVTSRRCLKFKIYLQGSNMYIQNGFDIRERKEC